MSAPQHALAQTQKATTQATDTYQGRTVVANRILLKFKQPPAAATLAAVGTATAATRLRPLGGAGWYILDSPTRSVAQLLATLTADADVARAEPDYIGHPTAVRSSAIADRITPMFDLPNDPFYSSQWAFENTGQTIGGITGTPGADINAPAAWDLSTGSKSVVLVNFDTGIDYNNPDLAPNVWSAPSDYTITEGGNVYNCPAGSHGFNAIDNQSGCAGREYDNGANFGHGTLGAGAMAAATNNGIGVAGTDWSATLLSISICTSTCDSSTAVTGIDAALQIASHFGLDIAVGNFSHGGLDDSALADEMTLAGAETGMLFAASTGDECHGVENPAGFYLPNEIAVSGSDMKDNVGQYAPGECSNSGGDIAAPSVNVYTTFLGDTTGNAPHRFDGTSLSTPIVSGPIGLLESACPLPPPVVKATILGTADQIPALTGISTNGRRLNLGNALASCAGPGHTAGTGTVQIHFTTNEFNPDTGSINVTIDGYTTSYSYDTSVDTVDTVGQGLADYLSGSSYWQAPYQGSGLISIVTTAKGPYTAYSLSTSVTNDCDPPSDCGRAPTVSHTGIIAGN